MANQFSIWLKKKLIGRNQNLLSLEDPYKTLQKLLKDFAITGILDGGASRGHISERFLRLFPSAHVYAFEPCPIYHDILLEYARHQPRFHPEFAALSDEGGTVQLRLTASPGQSSLLNPKEDDKKPCQQGKEDGSKILRLVSVPAIAIDQWARDKGNIPIQVMKFDIQGYELFALRGAVEVLASSTLAIYTEVWLNPAYEGGALLGDLDAFLRERGFVLYDLYKPKYNSRGQVHWANALYIRASCLERR